MFFFLTSFFALGWIAQLGFSNALLLAWGAAATIPIAIHLLRRYRRLNLPWAAMQLLQKVMDQHSRRSRIMQLLLLLIRVSVLLLLAVAIARPYLQDTTAAANPLASRANKVWILIIDTSYSMGYRSSGTTLLERAKQQAAQLIATSQSGDAFALIALDEPVRRVIATPTFDAQTTQTQIQQLRESARGCDLLGAVANASDIISDCKAEAHFPRDIEVKFYSDLGVDAWRSAIDGPVAKALAKLKQVAQVSIEPLTEKEPVNVAVESIIPATSRPAIGSTLSVDITLASFGIGSSQLPVQLELDGKIVASEKVDIQANQNRVIRLHAPIQTDDWSVLSVSIPADNLTVDNRIDWVIRASAGNRVLIVEPEPDRPSSWRLALQPASPSSQALGALNQLPGMPKLQVVSPLTWSSLPINGWDVLIFSDVVIADTNQLQRLAEFVKQGGSVIMNWGGRQATGQLQSLDSQLSEFLGFQFLQPSLDGDWSIDPLEYRSPLVTPFIGFPNSGLLTTPIFRYWQIEATVPGLLTDLSLTSGDPLIVRRRLGMGWIVSILSAPQDGLDQNSDVWNAITTWPSFLPLAQQVVQTVVDNESDVSNRLAGQSLSGRSATFTQAATIQLERPDQSQVSLASSGADNLGRGSWIYSNTDLQGVYRVNSPKEFARPFAININPAQSSMQSINPQAIQEYISSVVDPIADRQSVDTATNNDKLSRALLIMLAAVLLLESILAWAIGKQTA
jgi:Aerotolerance regulator N-terminal/von Willebrand factor type A domain